MSKFAPVYRHLSQAILCCGDSRTPVPDHRNRILKAPYFFPRKNAVDRPTYTLTFFGQQLEPPFNYCPLSAITHGMA